MTILNDLKAQPPAVAANSTAPSQASGDKKAVEELEALVQL